MAKIRIKTIKLGKDDELNKWLDEHDHQIADKGGPYPMDSSGIVWIMYDPSRQKVEAPKEITPTPPQTPVDLEKQRASQKAAAFIQMFKNDRQSALETIVKYELLLRMLPRQKMGKNGQPDLSKIADVKMNMKNAKIHLEEIDKMVRDLEEGKLEEILARDVDAPKIILTN